MSHESELTSRITQASPGLLEMVDPGQVPQDRRSTTVDAFGDGTRMLSKLILRAVCCASPPII
jgi:hypothetical protein